MATQKNVKFMVAFTIITYCKSSNLNGCLHLNNTKFHNVIENHQFIDENDDIDNLFDFFFEKFIEEFVIRQAKTTIQNFYENLFISIASFVGIVSISSGLE